MYEYHKTGIINMELINSTNILFRSRHATTQPGSLNTLKTGFRSESKPPQTTNKNTQKRTQKITFPLSDEKQRATSSSSDTFGKKRRMKKIKSKHLKPSTHRNAKVNGRQTRASW